MKIVVYNEIMVVDISIMRKAGDWSSIYMLDSTKQYEIYLC